MGMDRDLVKRLGSSRFNYWFGYVANLTLTVWLASHGFASGRSLLSPLAWAGWAAFGLASWTLCEYVLHRYVYHVWSSFLSTGHDLHHQAPRELIGVPWYLTAAIIVVLYQGLAHVFSPAPLGVAMAFTWLGYIAYCIAHHGSHHWSLKLPWLRQMKKHHQLHHAYPEYNWGFTTSFWDMVFGTHWARSPEAKRRASAKHAGTAA